MACPTRPRTRHTAHVHVLCPVCEEPTLCFLIGAPEAATRDCPGTGPTLDDFTATCGHEPDEVALWHHFTDAIEETTH
jgi:hypothetical protein